jgi:hypothetical protein
MDAMNAVKIAIDTVDIDGCNTRFGEASASLPKTMASHQEREERVELQQQPVEVCQASEDTWALHDDDRHHLLGEWPETEIEESCSGQDIDGIWDHSSDGKGNHVLLEEHQQVLNGWSTSANSSSVESGRWCTSPGRDGSANDPGWFSDEKWYGCMGQPDQHETDVQDDQDDWMLPFDELIKGVSFFMPHAYEVPLVPPVQEALPLPAAGTLLAEPVCIWNARPDGCEHAGELAGHLLDGEKEIFTDGQQVFQPVPSATGESLFTDGKQLYAQVCVMFDSPSPAVALTPQSQTQGFCFATDSDDEDGECLG